MVPIPCLCIIKWPLTVLKIIFNISKQSEKPRDENVASKFGSPRNSDVPPHKENVTVPVSSRARTVNFYFHLSIYSSRLCVACNEKLCFVYISV